MPKYHVTLADGRNLDVYAPDEAGALSQALHHETTRVVIATKRDRPVTVNVASPVRADKIKD